MKNADGPAPEPECYADAMQLALDWACGRRSFTNMLMTAEADVENRAQTLALIAQTDTAEATKWATIAQAMAAEACANPAMLRIDVERLRRSIHALRHDVEGEDKYKLATAREVVSELGYEGGLRYCRELATALDEARAGL